MDVESFSQCLQYMNATSAKFSLDKLIPVCSALGGAIIGFTLNYLTSNKKERQAAQNKIMCCEEDVERIRIYSYKAVKAIGELCITTAQSRRITHHSVPSISSMCLSEYFIDVAHKFNSSQRESVQKLILNLEVLNKRTDELLDSKLREPYNQSTALLNSMVTAATILGECEDFKRKEIVSYSVEEVFGWAGATTEEIQAFMTLKDNAAEGNKILKLEKYIN